MGKLAGYKLILLGERDGIPGPAMVACLENSGAEIIFSSTRAFAETSAGSMEGGDQQQVKNAAEQYGNNLIIILGQGDAEACELYAETVTAGDPTFAGPLAGISLGLPVYHIFDPVIRAECDPVAWEEQVSMMEMVLEPNALVESTRSINEQYGRDPLDSGSTPLPDPTPVIPVTPDAPNNYIASFKKLLTRILSCPMVIETGAGGIWKWRKWSDGRSECWGRTAAKTYTFSSTAGNGYYVNESQDLPSGVFTSVIGAFGRRLQGTGSTPSNNLVTINVHYLTTTKIYYWVQSTAQNSTQSLSISLYVIGRWK